MNIIEQLGLREDPFRPADGFAGSGMAAPTQATFEKLVAAVRRADPLTVLVGRPGMGKTLLLNMLEQTCRADGLDVQYVARGDMAHTALGSRAQLLLVDEADSINTATLTALAPGGVDAAAPIMVFAVVQPALHRLSADVRTTVIDLRPLDPDGARQFLTARVAAAGRPDLFASEALDVIIDAARGSPRLLRVLAGAAMYQAAGDAAARIAPAHASLAATMHGRFLGPAADDPPLPVAANDAGPGPDEAIGHPIPTVTSAAVRQRRARQRVGVLSFAASVALAALVLPVLLVPDSVDAPLRVPPASASEAVEGPVQLASAFAVAPANAAGSVPVMLTLPVPAAPRMPIRDPAMVVVASRSDVASLTVGAGSALPRAIVPDAATDVPRLAPIIRPAVEQTGERAAFMDLLRATRLRSAAAARNAGREQGMEDDGKVGAKWTTLAASDAPSASAVPAFAALQPPPFAIDMKPPVPVVGSLGAANQAALSASVVALTVAPARQAVEAAQAAKSSTSEATAAKQAADTATSVKVATQAAKQSGQEARAAKQAAVESRSGKDASEQAQAAKLAADQAKAAKEAAKQAAAAKEAAEQAKAAKDAADRAKDAKDAAEKAKEAKEAADQAKAARDAADRAKEIAKQTKEAKEAADQAKAAKEAAEQSKAAKDAADQAKAAKEAADQAKAAKEAAEQAKAAKEAAEQAKSAKDAAEQAKQAKEAAEQAKSAKEAAEQAKAAKEAADQVKAAKEAAEQAKAAKEAAEQAQAAKEAAEQAKAAKDAADQAKAARDAADQAKAAKEAAEQAKAAKDAARAAKDARDAAKDAKNSGKGN